MINFELRQSNIREIDELVKSHLKSLANPMDSWLEDRLLESDIYKIIYKDISVGYAGLIKDTLHFFHIRKECFWYYNTLSRKSLESAGMIAASIGFKAVLKGKEKLPLRTGNPPGELVEGIGD